MILQRDFLLAHIVVYLREILMRRNTCRDPGADQNLTTTVPPPFSLSLSSKEKEWSELIHLLA